jgi:ABC transporter
MTPQSSPPGRGGLAGDRSRAARLSAADDVTLSVGAGEFVALDGASGSGKSTLLHIIGAIERPHSGTVVMDGTTVTALRGSALAAYRRGVGFVFQRYNLLPALTALDNVIAPVLPYRTGWDKRDRGRELLAAVGLAGREESLPARMSGGELQRWPSPGRWSTPRKCCSQTSRPATWIPRMAGKSWICSGGCGAAADDSTPRHPRPADRGGL